MFVFSHPNRSSLSEVSHDKTANNRIKITLSARAGSHSPFHKVSAPFYPPIPSQSPSTPTETHTESLPPTTVTQTTTSTSTVAPVPHFARTQSDRYHFSAQDDPLEIYDNVDEIRIPSSHAINPLTHYKRNHSFSSIRSSPSSLSLSTAPALVYIQPAKHFRMHELSELRFDQSTLKSYFMASPSTMTTTTTERPVSTTSAREADIQRQKILAFIVSENQPSSFKAPSTTSQKPLVLATNKEINSNNQKAFVHKQVPESTTSSHPNTTSTRTQNVYQSPTKTTLLVSRDQPLASQSVRLTLSSDLAAGSGQGGGADEIALIKSPLPPPRQTLHLKPIEPTTYSPQKPFRTSTAGEITITPEPSTTTAMPSSMAILLADEPSEFDPSVVHSRRRPYVNDFLTHANNMPTRFPPRSTSTSTTEVPLVVSEFTTEAPSSTTTFRSIIQSFTSRGLVFKENLNRTYEPQSIKPIVSPYISLETQRLTNAIRTTTARPYEYTTTTSPRVVTSTTAVPVSTYRSYFLITAPAKDKSSSIPSTFLFPEASTSTTTQASLRPSPFSVKSESTESSRGRYRPYVTFTSQNAIDDEPTTYSPRLRYNTRTQTMVDTVSSSSPPLEPVVRRKIVRLKSSALLAPANSFASSTESNRVDVSSPTPLRVVSEKFVPSPSRETSQLKPLAPKAVSKLSYSSDSPSTATRPSSNSFNQLPKEKPSSVELSNKPFFYIRFKNASSDFESQVDTTTKRFRATVEQAEMNVPTERELSAFDELKELYDEEEKNHSFVDIIEEVDGLHEVDYAYVDSTTTVLPSTYGFAKLNSTYSTIFEKTSTSTQPTTSTLTSTSSRTTEKELTTTTANPKSLIPPRTSRVNNAIKTSIVAGLPRRNSASIKCNDISANAKCNEIPTSPSRYYMKFFSQIRTQTQIALDNQPKDSFQQRFDF